MAFKLFAILQKYDFSSKSQPPNVSGSSSFCCLRYCKSTIFQANHNSRVPSRRHTPVVCDTAKVRFFKQITTSLPIISSLFQLFAILQKYDFSSKSQQWSLIEWPRPCCLRYCKSTIFQANHNTRSADCTRISVVCDTAKVRFFKQITTPEVRIVHEYLLFAILQKYDFSSKSQLGMLLILIEVVLTFNGSMNWVEFIFFVW